MDLIRGLEKAWNRGLNEVQQQTRSAVSGDRHRFQLDGFDLDLTYITPRLIAMGFPGSTTTETLYRNDIADLARMLERYHGDHFCIFNCSEKDYNYLKFVGHYKFFGWNDHHSPPMRRLYDVVVAVDAYLNENTQNVALIHCMAGKSRTGTVITSTLIYRGECATADEARTLYNGMRGVTPCLVLPSQVYALKNFEKLLHTAQNGDLLTVNLALLDNPPPKLLQKIVIHPVPNAGVFNEGWRPLVEVFDENGLLFSNAKPLAVYTPTRKYKAADDAAVIIELDCLLCGDILMRFSHVSKILSVGTTQRALFKLAFHTSFIDNGSFLDFSSVHVDAVTEDLPLHSSDIFDKEFAIRLMFNDQAQRQEQDGV